MTRSVSAMTCMISIISIQPTNEECKPIYLVDIWPVRRVHLKHAVDEVSQSLGICRLWVFILRVQHSHGY